MIKYVIIDLEMARVHNKEKKEAFGHDSELIQIGAVGLSEDFEVEDTFMTYVHPEFGIIDKFIKRLTGITNEDVKDAPHADEALKAFMNWVPEGAVIVSWSMSDMAQLKREIEGKNIDLPHMCNYYASWVDCQESFSEKIHDKRNYKLKDALDICGIEYIEKYHDALADAINTGKLFKRIMECKGEMKLSPYYIPAEYASSIIFDPFAMKYSHGSSYVC